jgi:hypothetical protein
VVVEDAPKSGLRSRIGRGKGPRTMGVRPFSRFVLSESVERLVIELFDVEKSNNGKARD